MEARLELGSHPYSANADEAAPAQTPPAPATSAWESAAPHVYAYLRLLGVRQDEHLRLLSERIRARWENRLQRPIEEEDPSEVAIEEIQADLMAWLQAELDLPDAAVAEQLRARAAVLSGAVAGWVERWLGLATVSVAPAIRAALLSATPAYAELPMPTQPIVLRGVRLRRRLAALLRYVTRSFRKKRS